ncbi:MAG: addiction module protein [Pyrinomonadaceae bacterium]|nr:addiction module protein [Pyrinomonadaceae bacterium]
MATELEKLRDDLLALPVESRASLAQALIESLLEGADEDAETLWREEIRRRDADIRSGRAVLKPAGQVLREARERLRCMKS